MVDAEKGHGFLPDRYHCSLVELAGLKRCSCTKSHTTTGLFACWKCSSLLPFPRSFFYRCGVGSWLPLLLTPPRSHQPLWAPGGSRLLRHCPSSGNPSAHPTTEFCCRLCRNRSYSAPELLTSATQHCMTLQKLLTNLYWFVRRLYITTLSFLNYFSPSQ